MRHEVAIVTLFTDLQNTFFISKKISYIIPPQYLSRLCRENLAFRWIFGFWLLLYLGFLEGKKADVLNPHNFPAHWIAGIIGLIFRKPVVWICNEPPMRISFKQAQKIGIQEFFAGLISTSFVDRILVKRFNTVVVLWIESGKS